MNLNVLTRTMKIVKRYTMDPASGPLRVTAGQEGFLNFSDIEFLVIEPSRGHQTGVAEFIVTDRIDFSFQITSD
jgi:hypothetical protein